MGRRRKEWEPEEKSEYEAEAIEFLEKFTRQVLEKHEEPTRAGTSRGNPIGFSTNKMRAACLMLGHPVLFSLADIAGRCETTEGTLQVWRTQRKFRHVVAEKGLEFGRNFARVFSKVKIPPDTTRDGVFFSIMETMSCLSLGEGFFPIIRSLEEEFGPIGHRFINEIMNAHEIDGRARYRNFMRQPWVLKFYKAEISRSIDALIKPAKGEMTNKGYDARKPYADRLKMDIFATIDYWARRL